MGSDDNQKEIHRFLCEHYKSQKIFTRAQLFAGTTWKNKSQDTYWPKQIAQLVKEESKGKFKVGRRFGLYLISSSQSGSQVDRLKSHLECLGRVSVRG